MSVAKFKQLKVALQFDLDLVKEEYERTPTLTKWERNFVEGLPDEDDFITPLQGDKLMEIVEKINDYRSYSDASAKSD